ncbi:alpha/beta hydrolase [Leptospira sp. 96542]|nr:alpha/beta hydrolase [Leptospira sp. 96542]
MERKYFKFERDGFLLNCIIIGNGKPVIVIGSSDYYANLFPKEIYHNYQFIFLDHRGFAKKNEPINPLEISLSHILDDCHEIQKHLKTEECIIIGHSGHGYMALEYAKKFKENVKALHIIATGPSFGVHMLESEKRFEKEASEAQKNKHRENQIRFAQDIQKEPDRFFKHYCRSMDAKGFYDWNFDSKELWEGIHTNKIIFDHLFGSVFRDIQIEKSLLNINCPILVCMGKYDFQAPPYFTWDPFLKQFPNIKLSVFEKSGHLPFWEEPKLWVDLWENWNKTII